MNETKSNGKRKFQAFGPWATALDTGPGAALSTFWRRRMAMLSTLNRDSGRASWRLRVMLIAGGLAVLALPGLYLSRAEVAQAEPSDTAEAPEIAEPADVAPPEAPVPPPEKPAVEKPVATPKAASAADQKPAGFVPNKAKIPLSVYRRTAEQPAPISATFEPKPKAIPEPSVEYFPEPTEVEKRINEELDKQASIEFTETPLIDAIMAIQLKMANYHVEIQLDNRALEDAGMDGSTLVTRTVKDVSIRTVLRLLLGELDLTYLIQDEVLLITTIDKAETQLVTRTYPIGDLLADVPVMSHKGGLGGKAVEKTPVEPEQPARLVKDYDSLIECITTTVVPQSWDEVGGPGSITEMPVSSSVVISQTPVVHDEVLQLIRALRAAKRASSVRSAN